MIDRNEYPRPQFRRENWQGLNGEWEFAFDDKNEGIKVRIAGRVSSGAALFLQAAIQAKAAALTSQPFGGAEIIKALCAD